MYNRYLSDTQETNAEKERQEKRPSSPGPQYPPFYAPKPAPPPPPPPPDGGTPKPVLDGLGSLGQLLGNLHIPSLELDDILLLLILFLILREDGDEDLMLILGALSLLGKN